MPFIKMILLCEKHVLEHTWRRTLHIHIPDVSNARRKQIFASIVITYREKDLTSWYVRFSRDAEAAMHKSCQINLLDSMGLP